MNKENSMKECVDLREKNESWKRSTEIIRSRISKMLNSKKKQHTFH